MNISRTGHLSDRAIMWPKVEPLAAAGGFTFLHELGNKDKSSIIRFLQVLSFDSSILHCSPLSLSMRGLHGVLALLMATAAHGARFEVSLSKRGSLGRLAHPTNQSGVVARLCAESIRNYLGLFGVWLGTVVPPALS